MSVLGLRYYHHRSILTSDAAEAPDELAALLALVRDDLERRPEVLVVVRQPLQQRLALHQLQLHTVLLVREVRLVLLLLGRQVQDRLRRGDVVLQDVALDV